jgi:PTS system ascorbate-specific IIB component
LKKISILAVCGFGVGSSLLLKINISNVAKTNQVDAEVNTGDVATATSTPCDVIFTSKELAETMKARAKVPVVVINSFVDKKEISEKLLKFVKTIK